MSGAIIEEQTHMQTAATLYDLRRAARSNSLPPSLVGVGTVQSTQTHQLVMRFTPADAKRLLQNAHPKQRKINKARVQQLLRSMQTGQWHEPPFTFDSIAFDTEGRICNGLHRLTALAQYDKPLSFFVIIGVQSPDKMPLPEGDSGIPRPKSFVAGIERNEWAVVTCLAEYVFSNIKEVSRTDLQMLHPLFVDALAAIPRVTTHSPAAPIRAAFVFCYTQSSDAVYRQAIAEQWRAYCTVEVFQMWPSIGKLYKKIQSMGATHGGGLSLDRKIRFESTVYALRNPEAQRITRQPNAGQEVKAWVDQAVQP